MSCLIPGTGFDRHLVTGGGELPYYLWDEGDAPFVRFMCFADSDSHDTNSRQILPRRHFGRMDRLASVNMFGKENPRVVWTRGEGCAELAEILAGDEAERVVGDVVDAVLRHRADLLVARKLWDRDLVSLAIPIDFRPNEVRVVVAAVGGGPHSEMAARLAKNLGSALGLRAFMVSAHRGDEDREQVTGHVSLLAERVPELDAEVRQAVDIPALIQDLPQGSLLVMGAAGGGWVHRNLLGSGAKLLHNAASGAVIVKYCPEKAFQLMTDPLFVGPFRSCGDVLRVHQEALLPVLDRARMIGLVTREDLLAADPMTPVQQVMIPPESVPMLATTEEIGAFRENHGPVPVPVTGDDLILVGTIV